MPRLPHPGPALARSRDAALAAALAVAAGAQAPSPWAQVHIPGGVVASQIANIGKIVAYHDGATLHAWSAMTRRWHAIAAPVGGALRTNNDCLLLQQQATWIAFASWTGQFAPLAVGPGAVLHNLAGASNDSLLAVTDGGMLHVFSAFTGAWVARPVGPNHVVSVQRHVAVLIDGTTVGGFDAWTGGWHDLTAAAAPTVASADGTAGFAYGAGTIHAFSATRLAWTSAPEPLGATFTRGDDWGTWHGANGVTAYGAVHGAFARTRAPAVAVASIQDVFALLQGPTSLFAFSALTNAFSPPLAAATATASTGTAVALIADANGTRAWSAVNGRVAAVAGPGAQSGVANVIAWVDTGINGPPSFFSALTGRWHPAPAGVLPGQPLLTATSAACPTATGCVAFSPRTGAFVPLADASIALFGNPSSAPLLAVGSAALHGFDARAGRWVSTPHALVGPANVQIWRTAAAVLDGSLAFGFGAQAGTWSATTLPGPVTGIRANSESVRISTASHLIAWSAMAEVAWFAQFPEFRRVQPAGVAMPLAIAVPPAGAALLGIGPLAPVPVVLPGLGSLLLDGSALALTAVAAAPGGVPLVVPITAAAGPALLGVELGAQAAMVPAAGAIWLTDAATVMPL